MIARLVVRSFPVLVYRSKTEEIFFTVFWLGFVRPFSRLIIVALDSPVIEASAVRLKPFAFRFLRIFTAIPDGPGTLVAEPINL